jgi:hypothetical protein
MEKLRQSITKDLPIILIYLDELKEIWELLEAQKKENNKVEIKTKEHQFENIEELKNLPYDKIHNLEITLHNPYLAISLSNQSTRIYASTDTSEIVGLVVKINNILLKGKRSLVNFIFNSIFTIFFGFVISIIPWVFRKQSMSNIALTAGCLILLYVIFHIISFRVEMKQHSTIVLSYRKQKKSFWCENKNKILLIIISAIAGAIFGIIGQIIFKKYL